MRTLNIARNVVPPPFAVRALSLLSLLTVAAACMDVASEDAAGGGPDGGQPGLSCSPGAAPTEPTASLVVDPRTVEYAPELGVDFANMVATPEGLFCADLVVGDGAVASPRSTVSVHYTGTLADGTVFDDSRERGQPFPFILGTRSVIPGWDIGVAGMREGGRRLLVIPSELAYGPEGAQDENGVTAIPGNAVLVFDVEVVQVN